MTGRQFVTWVGAPLVETSSVIRTVSVCVALRLRFKHVRFRLG